MYCDERAGTLERRSTATVIPGRLISDGKIVACERGGSGLRREPLALDPDAKAWSRLASLYPSVHSSPQINSFHVWSLP